MRCLDGITDSTDMSLSKFWEIVKDIGACHVAVHGVAKRQDLVTGQQQQVSTVPPTPWVPPGPSVTPQSEKEGRPLPPPILSSARLAFLSQTSCFHLSLSLCVSLPLPPLGGVSSQTARPLLPSSFLLLAPLPGKLCSQTLPGQLDFRHALPSRFEVQLGPVTDAQFSA